jgi:hypothetical protein
MSFKISDFRSAIGAGSRPNLFKIRISAPAGYDLTAVEYLCRSASLPSSTLGTIEIPMNAGRRLKMGGDRVFSEYTTTILNDEDFKSRSVLERWQNDIVKTNFGGGVIGNRNAGSLSVGTTTTKGLYGTVEVFQLREDGSSVNAGEYKLINCWPSDISSIDLSYDTTDAVEDYTVTWTYDYFEIGTPTNEIAGNNV